eukprot:TRINITY_DN16537_c0_g1_i2.p1 TRINITY_DN16537_c0_g1~~TRINITY_DN16537_c0_g1_i2.p1  ORF type:complete len:2556 (+),score=313.91 TRINITY_DN16537_c0_g1_i2:398-7669(+)
MTLVDLNFFVQQLHLQQHHLWTLFEKWWKKQDHSKLDKDLLVTLAVSTSVHTPQLSALVCTHVPYTQMPFLNQAQLPPSSWFHNLPTCRSHGHPIQKEFFFSLLSLLQNAPPVDAAGCAVSLLDSVKEQDMRHSDYCEFLGHSVVHSKAVSPALKKALQAISRETEKIGAPSIQGKSRMFFELLEKLQGVPYRQELLRLESTFDFSFKCKDSFRTQIQGLRMILKDLPPDEVMDAGTWPHHGFTAWCEAVTTSLAKTLLSINQKFASEMCNYLDSGFSEDVGCFREPTLAVCIFWNYWLHIFIPVAKLKQRHQWYPCDTLKRIKSMPISLRGRVPESYTAMKLAFGQLFLPLDAVAPSTLTSLRDPTLQATMQALGLPGDLQQIEALLTQNAQNIEQLRNYRAMLEATLKFLPDKKAPRTNREKFLKEYLLPRLLQTEASVKQTASTLDSTKRACEEFFAASAPIVLLCYKSKLFQRLCTPKYEREAITDRLGRAEAHLRAVLQGRTRRSDLASVRMSDIDIEAELSTLCQHLQMHDSCIDNIGVELNTQKLLQVANEVCSCFSTLNLLSNPEELENLRNFVATAGTDPELVEIRSSTEYEWLIVFTQQIGRGIDIFPELHKAAGLIQFLRDFPFHTHREEFLDIRSRLSADLRGHEVHDAILESFAKILDFMCVVLPPQPYSSLKEFCQALNEKLVPPANIADVCASLGILRNVVEDSRTPYFGGVVPRIQSLLESGIFRIHITENSAEYWIEFELRENETPLLSAAAIAEVKRQAAFASALFDANSTELLTLRDFQNCIEVMEAVYSNYIGLATLPHPQFTEFTTGIALKHKTQAGRLIEDAKSKRESWADQLLRCRKRTPILSVFSNKELVRILNLMGKNDTESLERLGHYINAASGCCTVTSADWKTLLQEPASPDDSISRLESLESRLTAVLQYHPLPALAFSGVYRLSVNGLPPSELLRKVVSVYRTVAKRLPFRHELLWCTPQTTQEDVLCHICCTRLPGSVIALLLVDRLAPSVWTSVAQNLSEAPDAYALCVYGITDVQNSWMADATFHTTTAPLRELLGPRKLPTTVLSGPVATGKSHYVEVEAMNSSLPIVRLDITEDTDRRAATEQLLAQATQSAIIHINFSSYIAAKLSAAVDHNVVDLTCWLFDLLAFDLSTDPTHGLVWRAPASSVFFIELSGGTPVVNFPLLHNGLRKVDFPRGDVKELYAFQKTDFGEEKSCTVDVRFIVSVVQDATKLAVDQNSLSEDTNTVLNHFCSMLSDVTRDFRSVHIFTKMLADRCALFTGIKLDEFISPQAKREVVLQEIVNHLRKEVIFLSAPKGVVCFSDFVSHGGGLLCGFAVKRDVLCIPFAAKLPASLQGKLDLQRMLSKLGHSSRDCLNFVTLAAALGLPPSDESLVQEQLAAHGFILHDEALLRILLVLQYQKLRIPLVLQSETGHGKTFLLKVLSELQSWALARIRPACERPSQPLMLKMLVHPSLTEKDFIRRVEPVIQASKKHQFNIFTIFLDELNTASCMSFLACLIIDRTLRGQRLPDNLAFVVAVNPHSSQAGGAIGTRYCVQPLPDALHAIAHVIPSLPLSELRNYITAALLMRWPEKNTDAFVVPLADLVLTAHTAAERHTVVSQRDVQRTLEMIHQLQYHVCLSVASTLAFGNAVIIAVAMCYVLRFKDSALRLTIGRELLPCCRPFLELAESTDIEFTQLVMRRLRRIVNRQNFEIPKGVALTAALVENVVAILLAVLTKIPVGIIGAPGSSKTLSLHIIRDNLRGHYSPNDFCRNFPALEISFLQGSVSLTSEEITAALEAATKREETLAASPASARVLVFFDEAGLPDESAMTLKALHPFLDNKGTAFVCVSNREFDAANQNRLMILDRPKEVLDDFLTLARETLNLTEGSIADQQLGALCEAFLHRPPHLQQWFHSRDFIFFIRRLRTCMQDERFCETDVLCALEENFNGLPEEHLQEFYASCFASVASRIPPFAMPTPRGQLEVFRRAVNEHATQGDGKPVWQRSRFKLLIDPTADELVFRQCRAAGFFEGMRIIRPSPLASDSSSCDADAIADVRYCMESGTPAVLVDCQRIFGHLFDLLNQNIIAFQRSGSTEHFAMITIGSRTHLCLVHPSFFCIVILREDQINSSHDALHQHAAFLSRHEKYRITVDMLLSDQLLRLPEGDIGAAQFLGSRLNSFLESVGEQLFCGDTPTLAASLMLSITRKCRLDPSRIRTTSFTCDPRTSLVLHCCGALLQLLPPEAFVLRRQFLTLAPAYDLLYFDAQDHFDIAPLLLSSRKSILLCHQGAEIGKLAANKLWLLEDMAGYSAHNLSLTLGNFEAGPCTALVFTVPRGASNSMVNFLRWCIDHCSLTKPVAIIVPVRPGDPTYYPVNFSEDWDVMYMDTVVPNNYVNSMLLTWARAQAAFQL